MRVLLPAILVVAEGAVGGSLQAPPLPAVGAPVHVEVAHEGSAAIVAVDVPSSGTMRLLLAQSADQALGTLAIAAASPLDHAGAAADRVVSWSDHDREGLHAPGFIESPASALPLALDDSFLGWFTSPDVVAYAERPDGTIALAQNQIVGLADPETGIWTFHVAPTSRLGLATDKMYLFGAALPRLGIAG